MSKDFNIDDYIAKILPIIKEKNGVVTAGDVSIKTGFPLIHVKYVLNILANRFIADISVENSFLVYRFDLNRAKNSLSFKDILFLIIKKLYKFFMILSKISIATVLVGYFIFFIPIIVLIND